MRDKSKIASLPVKTSPEITVSVIIPTHNRAHTITRALDSVYNQTFKPTEVIVVDDGSTDETRAVLSSYKDLTVLHQDNQGVSSARNTAINHAQSTWLAFLDSDDEWLPEKLMYQVEFIKHYQEARICHCDEIWIRNGKRVNPANRHEKSGGWIYPDCLPLCVISPSAVMIHREIFEKIGLFDAALPACEDYDLWLRICSQWPVSFIDRHLLKKYGGHEDQLSKRFVAMDRFRIHALLKILRTDKLNTGYRQATIYTLQNKLTIYLNGLYKRDRHAEAEQILESVTDLIPLDQLRNQLNIRESIDGETTV